jgi:hypothetical protein
MVLNYEVPLSYCADALAAVPYYLKMRDDLNLTDHLVTNQHWTGLWVTQTPRNFAKDLRMRGIPARLWKLYPATQQQRAICEEVIVTKKTTMVYAK